MNPFSKNPNEIPTGRDMGSFSKAWKNHCTFMKNDLLKQRSQLIPYTTKDNVVIMGCSPLTGLVKVLHSASIMLTGCVVMVIPCAQLVIETSPKQSANSTQNNIDSVRLGYRSFFTNPFRYKKTRYLHERIIVTDGVQISMNFSVGFINQEGYPTQQEFVPETTTLNGVPMIMNGLGNLVEGLIETCMGIPWLIITSPYYICK